MNESLKNPGFLVRGLDCCLRFYQICLSPLLGRNCRFHPSCSTYAREALSAYGVFGGLKRAFFRICRCHPFSSGGYDPVQ